MRFQGIPQFTRHPGYAVDQSWDDLNLTIEKYVKDYGLDLNPDFQRGYVWTPEQQTRFIEYGLKGGQSGRSIYFNHPNWNTGIKREPKKFVIVDGKQRLEAVLAFLRNEVPIFGGHYYRDFEDSMNWVRHNFRFHINDLKTRAEVLQWYLDLNSGGTVHSDDELNRVRALLATAKGS
jgi:hypothetical protein